jgi:hypothetical protein
MKLARSAPSRLIPSSLPALAGAVILWLAGCAAPPVPVMDEMLTKPRYLRYTLRGQQAGLYTETWRSNYLSMPAVYKPGSKVEFPMYSEDRIDMTVDGLPAKMFTFDTKFPTTPDGMKQFLDKHFAASVGELNLAKVDPQAKLNIDSGNAAVNMTKEQVLMAIGYPAMIDDHVIAADLSRERILESNQWIYRWSAPVWVISHIYQFNSEGKLANVIR